MNKEELNKAAEDYAKASYNRDVSEYNSKVEAFKAGWKARDSQPLPDMEELRERFKKDWYNGEFYDVPHELDSSTPIDKDVIFNWFEREFKGVVEKESVEFHKWAYRQGWNYIDGEWVNVSLSKSSEELYQLYLQSKNELTETK